MPGLKYFKTFEKAALADGATWEETWTPDENLKIKRIHIIEKGGSVPRKSTFYYKVKEAVYTHSVVPCNVLGETVQITPELNFPLGSGQTLAFTLKNQEGAAKDFFVVFEAWEP